MGTDSREDEMQHLEAATTRWVAAGLMSAEQAEAIRSFELTGMPVTAPAPPAIGVPGVRLSLAAELLSYLGIILVAVSGTLSVVRFWSDLHLGGRLAVGVAIAGVGLVGGTEVNRIGDPGAHRLGGLLWFGGTGGVALVAGVTADAAGGGDASLTVMVIGLAVTALSAVLWRNLDRPLQMLATLAGIGLSVGGFLGVIHIEPTLLEAGIIVWCAGVIVGLAGLRHVVHPDLVALMSGEVLALYAAMTMANGRTNIGLGVGLATAAASIAIGLMVRRSPIVVVGVVGFLGFLAATLARYLNGPAAALGVFAVGLVLLLTVLFTSLRKAQGNVRGRGILGHH